MKKNILILVTVLGTLVQGCLEKDAAKTITEPLNQGDFTVVSAAGTGAGEAVATATPAPSTVTTPLPADFEGFVINGGAALATSRNLSFDFFPPFQGAQMKINEGQLCSGGTWINYEDHKNQLSSKANQTVYYSVQFRDYDYVLSPCYTASIIIDEAGPEIIFAKYPSGIVEEGADVEIIFSVNDYGSGVAEVTCQVGSISKPCAAGENKVSFKQLGEGDYHLRVSARDRAGFSSEKSVDFKVSSLYSKWSQQVRVRQYQKVDILFVIDNSRSMAYEQKSMASRVRNFLNVLKGLDWQIAVTTTDPVNKTYGDGRLVPLYGKAGVYILDSTMPEAEARETLSMTLQRPETGSGSEQGIYAAYRAIERALSASTQNANFIRSDSQLAVVLISDEDESANGARNDPATFMKFISDAFNGQKSLSFHSVIARPDDVACLTGEGAAAGHRYKQLSELTGGVIGDVCASDYAEQVKGIAEGVRRTLKTITLSCAPVINNQQKLEVLKDGTPYLGARQVSGLNLVFDEMLPAGEYEVRYNCLK